MLAPLSASPAYAIVAVAPWKFDEPLLVGDHPLSEDSPCYVIEQGHTGIRVIRVRQGRPSDFVSLHMWGFNPRMWKVLIVRTDRTTTGLCITERYNSDDPNDVSLVFRTGLVHSMDAWALCRSRKWRFRNQGINFDRP